MPDRRLPLEPGKAYHIWTHANGSDNLFRSPENYRYFLEKYSKYAHPVVETFAYCLMPNHLHLMVRVRGEEEIIEVMKKKSSGKNQAGFRNLSGFVTLQFSHLFNAYSKAYNKLYNRKGGLFQRAYRRKHIHSEAYFTRLIAYIHNNPVHHGFVKHPEYWPHSSWHAYVGDKETRIRKVEVINWFGGMEAFLDLHGALEQAKPLVLEEEA